MTSEASRSRAQNSPRDLCALEEDIRQMVANFPDLLAAEAAYDWPYFWAMANCLALVIQT